MKKQILFIGVGQCGGNIANEAQTQGFPSIAINSCKGDLDSLSNVSNKIHLTGYSGAGKIRSKGKEALRDNMEQVIEKIAISADTSDIDIIMVCFSSDGGTGSGIGPDIANILSEVLEDKIICTITVIPSENDTIGVLANSLECISDLSNVERLGTCFFIDNGKLLSKGHSKSFVYNKTNVEIIEKLASICEASHMTSSDGNFDRADLVSVFSARGAGIIGEIGVPINFNNHVGQMLINSWDKSSIFAPPQYDGKIVNAGFIYKTATDFKIEKGSIFDHIGTPIVTYEGDYRSKDQKIITILTGLTFPFNVVNRMEAIVEQNKNKIQDTIQSSLNQKFESKSSWVSDLRSPQKKSKPDEKVSLQDKLKKFK